MPEAYPQSLPPEPRTRAVVIRLVGEFDGCAERLFMACVQHLVASGFPEVLFDFGRVQFTDASGIRCLLQAQRQLRGAGQEMALVGVPPAIERILTLVGMRHAFTIYDDLDAAGLSCLPTRVAEQQAM